MADLERTYNIPLRKEVMKVPTYKRSKKAMTAIREFLEKHMKSESITLGQKLNMHVWKHGIKQPPHHVKVVATKNSEGHVTAELEGHKFEAVTQKAKAADDNTIMGKMKKKMGVDDASIAKAEEEDKAEAAKKAKTVKVESKPTEPKVEKPAEPEVEAKPAEKAPEPVKKA